MTPTVDREQLAALGMLRRRFGNVQVLAVIDQPATQAGGPGGGRRNASATRVHYANGRSCWIATSSSAPNLDLP